MEAIIFKDKIVKVIEDKEGGITITLTTGEQMHIDNLDMQGFTDCYNRYSNPYVKFDFK